jgi:hypothetical protein
MHVFINHQAISTRVHIAEPHTQYRFRFRNARASNRDFENVCHLDFRNSE